MEKKTTVVCMGDSITEGFGIKSPYRDSYPAKLGTFLGDGYFVSNKGVTSTCVTNKEQNGRTFGLPYARQPKYKEALFARGDIYIIMLGTNDAQDGKHDTLEMKDRYNDLINLESEFEGYYQQIIDDVKKAAPNASIFVVTPIPVNNCIWRKHQESYLLKIIPHIKNIARKNSLELIDLHEEVKKLPREVFLGMYQEDGLHPNETGAELIAQLIDYLLVISFKFGLKIYKVVVTILHFK
nr:hypothetical protein [Lachnospiraceae bacterium]